MEVRYKRSDGTWSAWIAISDRPFVSSTGQLAWSVRDLLFSPSRLIAAEVMKRLQSK